MDAGGRATQEPKPSAPVRGGLLRLEDFMHKFTLDEPDIVLPFLVQPIPGFDHIVGKKEKGDKREKGDGGNIN
jgi:hypothetical protein